MELGRIEKNLASFLEANCALRDIEPFLRTYIRLLCLFEGEISPEALDALQERQKQLHGEEFSDQAFDEIRISSRSRLDRDLRNTEGVTRDATLNRMLLCAFLDTEESDVFYLTEPIFEFARNMQVSPSELKQMLESEFVGLKIEN